jgi:hypothetical protein
MLRSVKEMNRYHSLISGLIICITASIACAGEAERVAQLFRAALPESWLLSESTAPPVFDQLPQFRPISELSLVEIGKEYAIDIGEGRKRYSNASIVLYAYPMAKREEIMEAVGKAPDPPLLYGETSEYLFVTSPGLINAGVRSSHEMMQTLKYLVEALSQGMGFHEVVTKKRQNWR